MEFFPNKTKNKLPTSALNIVENISDNVITHSKNN